MFNFTLTPFTDPCPLAGGPESDYLSPYHLPYRLFHLSQYPSLSLTLLCIRIAATAVKGIRGSSP